MNIQRRPWHPTSVLLPGKPHGWRSLEWLHFHFSLSCIGEGNGNPLQCSCLENPRDGGAWWAAIYGVAQSRTRLKRLSSSSSSYEHLCTIFLWTYIFNFLGVKFLGCKVWHFQKLPNVFQSDCTISQSYLQCMRIPFLPILVNIYCCLAGWL